MTNEQITALLPSGSQTRIARQVGVSKQAVSKVLQGKLHGAKAERIMKEARALAECQDRLNRAAAGRKWLASLTDDEFLNWFEQPRHTVTFNTALPAGCVLQPAPYSGHFTGSATGDLQQHDY